MKINPYLKGLGFKRDLPDIRDFMFESNIIRKKDKIFPKSVDLRGHRDMPPVYDQGSIGSCVAQSVGAVCDFEYGQDISYHPSTLFLYYVTRSLEGTVDVDSGSTIRNGIKAANEFGVAPMQHWPYIEEKFKDTPPQDVFDIAQTYQALKYKRIIQRLEDLKECLFEENLIAFGIGVYQSLYDVTALDPILKFPRSSDSLLGGHAIVAVGYDDYLQCFICRNSWGSSWGELGYFYIPYTFVMSNQLAMDFWIINLVRR